MLTKLNVIDKIEILVNNCIQVRIANQIIENGEVISTSFFRKVIQPGENYSREDDKIRAICQVIHTPEVVSEYQSNMKEI